VLIALGASLLFSAAAQATVTFTSAIPASPAPAGQSFEVTATSSGGAPVALTLVNRPSDNPACSWTKPPEEPGLLEEEGYYVNEPGGTAHAPPATVYLVAAGACTVVATSEGQAVSQEITVVKNPATKLAFTTTPPTNATVGGSYAPKVRESPILAVSYYIPTGYVCSTVRAEVVFYHPGTCTIQVRQAGGTGTGRGESEAEQSFVVTGPETATPETKTTPTTPKKAKPKKPRISSKVRARLIREALAVAARHTDRHPSEIEAVRVSEGQAQQLEAETRGTKGTSTGKTPVYFIAMRGNFQVGCTAGTCSSDTVLMLRLSTKTTAVMNTSLSNNYPNLESVGIPIALKSGK
jgi:hypothetical protein